ncbi:MAG: hypothetical protein K5873_01750 [Treponema sp.]|nr:hypothetical protein [Treponema sp.]
MRKINMSPQAKQNLITYAIFFGIIFGMTAILVTFTLLSRNSWKNSLAVEVQHVLDAYPEGTYTVGKNLYLNSTLSTSTVVYTLLKKDQRRNQKYYAILVRIPSILGPLPAVFIYSENTGVSFAGYAVDNGKAGATVDRQLSSMVMKYWEDMIPKIIEKTQEIKG